MNLYQWLLPLINSSLRSTYSLKRRSSERIRCCYLIDYYFSIIKLTKRQCGKKQRYKIQFSVPRFGHNFFCFHMNGFYWRERYLKIVKQLTDDIFLTFSFSEATILKFKCFTLLSPICIKTMKIWAIVSSNKSSMLFYTYPVVYITRHCVILIVLNKMNNDTEWMMCSATATHFFFKLYFWTKLNWKDLTFR